MKDFTNLALTIKESTYGTEKTPTVVLAQEGASVDIPIEQLGIVINHLDEIYKAHHKEEAT